MRDGYSNHPLDLWDWVIMLGAGVIFIGILLFTLGCASQPGGKAAMSAHNPFPPICICMGKTTFGLLDDLRGCPHYPPIRPMSRPMTHMEMFRLGIYFPPQEDRHPSLTTPEAPP